MNQPLPVTVIGGYLGSGKTTLVNHLLRNADGVRLAILVNEFGALAIDEDLIEAQDDEIISIAGGCVCCSFGSDLSAALMDLAGMSPPPDHILIEASGVAIPGAIVASLSLLNGFRGDGVVVLTDAETIRAGAGDKYMGDTVLRQIMDADIILLNKADLVSAADLENTKGWLQTQNPDARLVESTQSIVPPQAVLDSFIGRSYTPGPHHEAAALEMRTYFPKGPVEPEQLAELLASEDAGLVRAKGFVTSLNGEKMLIQVVGKRWQVTPAPPEKDDGIVCLGFKGIINSCLKFQ